MVSTVPGWFALAQQDALQEATGAAGIHELQLMKDVGEVALCAGTKGTKQTSVLLKVAPASSDAVADFCREVADPADASMTSRHRRHM